MQHWAKNGAPKNKLIMGVPLYGRSFTLGNKANTGINSGCWKAGTKGPITGEAGFLAYYEVLCICNKFAVVFYQYKFWVHLKSEYGNVVGQGINI